MFLYVMVTGRKKSPIWQFFTVEEDSKFAKCNKCEIKYLAEVNLPQHLLQRI